jgi:hypothetical protein
MFTLALVPTRLRLVLAEAREATAEHRTFLSVVKIFLLTVVGLEATAVAADRRLVLAAVAVGTEVPLALEVRLPSRVTLAVTDTCRATSRAAEVALVEREVSRLVALVSLTQLLELLLLTVLVVLEAARQREPLILVTVAVEEPYGTVLAVLVVQA